MTKLYSLVFFILAFSKIYGQTPSNVVIRGSIVDTASVALPSATVMLLSPKDSSLLHFARADDKGNFIFKNVKNRAYQLKVSYAGFIPKSMNIGPFEELDIQFNKLSIKPITKELLEVVVKTARAPLTMRGDTIEYDARAFKVPEGSTVEDLLRRLPGIEVDAAGNIKAQGKDVNRLYVDGKTFFGDDPKLATKNLGAETISKVQVFNEKSEQAKLTGVDDGKQNKAINLELKEEFKKGKFGKISAGLGNGELQEGSNGLLELKGNYNRFNEKEQFSIVGFSNNINRTGLSWDEMGEFKGESNNNWDQEELGFSSGIFYYFGNNDQDGLSSGFDGRGYTTNKAAGLNYNFDNKKKKFNANYYIKDNQLDLPTTKITENFLSNGSFTSTENSQAANRRTNHSLSTRFENMIDSSNTLILKASLNYRIRENTLTNIQQFRASSNINDTDQQQNNEANNDRLKAQTSVIYRYKFKKNKQRNISITGGYDLTNEDNNDNYNSVIKVLNAQNINDQIRNLSLLNTAGINSNIAKFNISYLTPINKKWFWESFYNVKNNNYNTNRRNFDNITKTTVDNLSNRFENTILYNRLGTSMRYSYKGWNISGGLAGLSYDITGNVRAYESNKETANISKKYTAITPNFNITKSTASNFWFDLSYNYSVTAPEIVDLMPLSDNSNPFFIREGNPDLSPRRSQNISLWFNKFDMATFAYLYGNISYNIFDSQIVYNQTIDSQLRTITKPVNLGGGYSVNSDLGFRFPIVKNKLNLNSGVNVVNGQSPSYINDILNTNTNNTTGFNIGFDFNPSTKFYINTAFNLSKTNLKYSIQSIQNQSFKNQGVNLDTKWNFAKKWFYESEFRYSSFTNERFGFDQKIPIWNHSIRKLFGKTNKWEGRISLVDALNRNTGIQLNNAYNQVYTEVAPTLARYFMATASYNIRGHIDKIRNNGF